MNPTIAIRIAVAAAVAFAIGFGVMYVKNLQTKVQELTTQNTVLGSKLTDQNTAIETLRSEGEARLAAAQEDLKVAEAAAAKGKQKAQVIYKFRPAVPVKDCETDRQAVFELVNGAK